MLMQSGRLVYPDNGAAPTLEDIGQGLGRITRWGGQTQHEYTVLPHTLTVVVLLEPVFKIHGLLHDAPEVCCSDVPTPWKSKEARDNEELILRRIYAEHGLTMPDEEAEAAVLRADLRALVAEAHVLGHSDPSVIEEAVGIKADEEAVELTRLNLELVPELRHAPTAQSIYREAFELYGQIANA